VSLQDIFYQHEPTSSRPQDAAAAVAPPPCSLKVQQASEEQQATTDSPRSTQEALGEGAATSCAVNSRTPEARNRGGAIAAAGEGAAAAAAGRVSRRGEDACASPSDASGASRADTSEGDMSGGSSQDC